MKSLRDKKVIFWDFDGVIINSMPIREQGFREVLSNYPQEEVQQLIDYHEKNAGLSRYVKFKYFFENIRKEFDTAEMEVQLIKEFSKIMKRLLLNRTLINKEVLTFIEGNPQIKMHVVSGSDGDELKYICKKLNIDKFFISIEGSPTPKNQLVRNLLELYDYDVKDVGLIGDSINDYEAAKINGIDFFGYNNVDLQALNSPYLHEID